MLDLRTLIRLTEKRGELIRIDRAVDRKFEMPALMTQAEAIGKAYLFENVRNSPFRVVGGLFNEIDRVALALEVPGRPHFNHTEMARKIGSRTARGIPPVYVHSAPCKEVVRTGAAINLNDIPVPTFFELDTGPFITGGVGISRNPETGALNVGCYRTLILSKDTMAVNASLLSDLHKFYHYAEKHRQKLSIALAIGVEPALLLAGVSKPPATATEFDAAGGLKGAPIELINAETNDLPVPAGAEFIIEGEVDFSQRVDNVLGEFIGLYGLENAPVMRVTAITHRDDALFYSILAGKNAEHAILGTIAVYPKRRKLIKQISALSRDIRGVNTFTDPKFGAMLHIAIAIDKQNEEQPEQLIRDVFELDADGFPVSQFVRRIIVVDNDVDISDLDDIEWAVWMRCTDANSIMIFPNMTSWGLDRSSDSTDGSMRLGIDATTKAGEQDAMIRPRTPGIEQIRLEDYMSDTGDPDGHPENNKGQE